MPTIIEIDILGFSESTIGMILDNLCSNAQFPKLNVINNLEIEAKKPFTHSKYEIEIIKSFKYKAGSTYFLGAVQVLNKIKIFEAFNLPINVFCNIIHGSSQISETTFMGKGCLVNSLVSVAAHSELGNFVSVNRNVSIGHHTKIGNFVTINPGSNIAGNVIIGDGTQIGMGSNILDGISIGKNCIIGAGALVTKDVPDNVVVYGSPAKIIKSLDS